MPLVQITPAPQSLQDTLAIGASATTQAVWTSNGIRFDDSVPFTFGTGSDATILYNGTDLIIDPRAVGTGIVRIGAATTDERALYAYRLGLGDTVNTSGALVQFSTSSSTISGVFSGTLTHTGSTATARTLIFTCAHQSTAATNTGLGGAFISNLSNDTSGTKTCQGVVGQIGVNVSITRGTVTLIGVQGQGAASAGSGHSGGTVTATSILGLNPANITGTSSYTRWAGRFEGDLQVSDDKYLILGGSSTSKATNRMRWSTSASAIQFDVGGTTQMSLASNLLTLKDAFNIAANATTGTKIGTATTQKLGFWNTAPIAQPTTAHAAATFVTNTSLIANDTATFDGYTIGQVVKALRDFGVLQ